MQIPPRPTLLPPDPDPAALAAWRAELAAAQSSPWLASLFARRLGILSAGFGELRQRLAALPRHFRRAWVRRWAFGLSLAALLLAHTNGGARAAAITVDPGGSGCTLEDAITAANTDTPIGSCVTGMGSDTISFANPNTTYTLFSNYGGPLPLINSNITIQGNGTTTLDGEGNLRSFAVMAGGGLTLNNLTITGGNATTGGGIYVNQGVLTATSVTIQGNYAADDGGGLYVYSGSITLTDCTISGNEAGDDGGGITVENSYLTIQSSTISGNTAGDVGGGLDPDSSVVYIFDSTIRGNSSGDDGGGIDADSSYLVIYGSTINNNTSGEDGGGINAYYSLLALTNATISGNSAQGNGGGILSNGSYGGIEFSTITGNSAGGTGAGIHSVYTEGSGIDIRNSIVAAQAAGSDCGGREPNSYGYNIESGTSCDFTEPGDQQSVSPAALDLGPLALNAPGSTETHALGAGSAALNQVPNLDNGCGTDVTDDQRGIVRPQFAACDVGAYELDAQAEPTPPPTAATLTQLGAQVDPTGRVQIAWETGSELDLVGFRVERSLLGAWGDPDAPAAGSWTAVGALVAAQGGASQGARYQVSDAVAPGHYAYRLVIVNAAAPPELHGPVTARVDALRAFLPVTLQR